MEGTVLCAPWSPRGQDVNLWGEHWGCGWLLWHSWSKMEWTTCEEILQGKGRLEKVHTWLQPCVQSITNTYLLRGPNPGSGYKWKQRKVSNFMSMEHPLFWTYTPNLWEHVYSKVRIHIFIVLLQAVFWYSWGYSGDILFINFWFILLGSQGLCY